MKSDVTLMTHWRCHVKALHSNTYIHFRQRHPYDFLSGGVFDFTQLMALKVEKKNFCVIINPTRIISKSYTCSKECVNMQSFEMQINVASSFQSSIN